MTRIAVAHDYLTQRGGAERVSLNLLDVFPGAPLYTSLYDAEATYPEFRDADIRTSPLDRVGFFRSHFRAALPFFPWAFDHTPVDPGTDVIVVSTTGFAHGIRTAGRKVVYCHSPARFLYLTDEYLGGPWWRRPTGWALMALRPMLRRWDRRAASSADVYLCNSTMVRDRIKRIYGIDARVVHPPAALDAEGPQTDVTELEGWPSYHLLVSRLLPYKNVHVAIDAFRQLPDERLLVIGRGPERERLAASLPPNVRLAEGLSDAQLRRAYAGTTSVVATSFEDFGLTPVEGYSFGVPTLALRAGGYLDTVIDGETGYFFDAADAGAIAAAVRRLADEPLAVGPILHHSERFSMTTFASQLHTVVDRVLAEGRTR